MGLTAKEEKTFDPIPAGVHQGVAYAIYDLGNQFSAKFEKTSHQALLIWEVPSERIEIEKDGVKKDLPRVVSRTFTMSLGERANLRKMLESWRGRTFTPEELLGFDISKLIGVNGMIQVIHTTKDGKTYANVSAVLPLYKGMDKLVPENPTVVYSIEDGEPPEGTPKWIVDKIHESAEWKASAPTMEDEPGEEVPF
jgi:hypothetical protein